jgi:hypothetical protein
VVDVVAKGLLLETQSGVTGNVVTAETIVNLPMSGRNITSGTTPSMRASSSRALRSPSRSSSAISSEGSSADQSFAARRSSWDRHETVGWTRCHCEQPHQHQPRVD